MAIPDEDLGPGWLRDWQHIDADIQAMDDFAKQLRADVETNYASHLTPIYDDMATALPHGGFAELDGLFQVHYEATQSTTNLVHDYANRSAGMAQAASDISKRYGESDAFSSATVGAVNQALGDTGVAAPQNGAGQPGTGATVPGPGQGTEGGTIPATEGY